MASIADTLLARGCAITEHIHGEPVVVLSGADAGKTFFGVIEIEPDTVLTTDLGEDARPKVIARFRSPPSLKQTDAIQTADGRKWHAVRQPGHAHLTVDFELIAISATKDT
jgi:hypothetical protein